jgi:hypothetical protein
MVLVSLCGCGCGGGSGGLNDSVIFLKNCELGAGGCSEGRHGTVGGSGWVVVGSKDALGHGGSNGVSYVMWLWLWRWQWRFEWRGVKNLKKMWCWWMLRGSKWDGGWQWLGGSRLKRCASSWRFE